MRKIGHGCYDHSPEVLQSGSSGALRAVEALPET
jgi:hypothetical protein